MWPLHRIRGNHVACGEHRHTFGGEGSSGVDGFTIGYLATFAVGGVSLLAALLVTDIGHGDGMPFIRLTTVSAALTGIGAGGLLASLTGLSALWTAVAVVAFAIVLVGGIQLFQSYLQHQQANSHTGRASYVGRLGTVTLEVPSGGGWGEVVFTDADGNRVYSRAVTAEAAALPKNASVYIADVDGEYLHVVRIPDSPSKELS